MNRLKSKAAAVWASRVGKLAVVGAVAVTLTLASASQSSAVEARQMGATAVAPVDSVVSSSIMDGQVGHPDLKDGDVWQSDMAPALVTEFRKVYNNTVGTPQLKDGNVTEPKLSADVQAQLALGAGLNFTCPAKVIVNIGGPFATNKTKVCSFDIPAGVWMVNSSAFFARTAAGVAGTRPQMALRWDNGSQWGADIGTILGGEISPTKDRELTGSAVKVVTLQEPITVDVYGFGYNDDASSAGSGDITVAVNVAAVRIG